MGRAKLKIRRLEAEAARQNTFLKRKFGIMKKLHELSVLCDIDCLLLMFPPMGKPILTLGEKSDLSTIVAKYQVLSPHERERRRNETLEILKRIYGKMSENIDVDTIDEKKKKLEEMHKELMEMNSRLVDAQHRLSQWTNLNNVNNLAHIRNMEETLVKSLDLFRNQKAEFFPRVPGNNIPPTGLRFINFETQGDTMQFVKHPCVVHPNFVSQVERNYPKQHPESGQEHLFGGIDLYPAGLQVFPIQQHGMKKMESEGSV